MSQANDKSPGYVIIKKENVLLDEEIYGKGNALGKEGNNGRKILANTLWEDGFELQKPIWTAPHILQTHDGGLEIATFTEYSIQNRHMHRLSTEIYTVLKGMMSMYINDEGPFVINESDEVVILPGTSHEIIEKKNPPYKNGQFFSLLVRVHAINCYGGQDKYVQLHQDGEWKLWDHLTDQERIHSYRKQDSKKKCQ